MSAPGSSDPPRKGRRALVISAAAGTCAIAAAVAGPAAALVLAPLRAGASSGKWVRTLAVDQLRDGEPKRVAIVSDRRDAWTIEKDVELGSVWLVKEGAEVRAYSAVCPHLGCSINATGKAFACPCHTSSFDAHGRRISGPSPRDMDTMATRIEDGFVVVDFRRFRIGIPEKVEA